MKHCDATNWNCAQVRRWLENEGFREFWNFLEPDAPITGQDLLSLTGELLLRYSQKIVVKICPSDINLKSLNLYLDN